MTTTIRHAALLALTALLLAACGSEDAQREEPPPVEETVFGDTVGTLDKARGVEGTTREHKEALDRALEQDSQ